MNATPSIVPSPCTGVCRLDEVTGFCLGCGRSDTEIAEWSQAGNERKRAIWAELPERFARLDITVTRLPWGRPEITEFVRRTLVDRSGTWVIGCHGATAEFMADANEAMETEFGQDALVATTAQGGLRFQPRDNFRALQWRDPRMPDETRAIFIVIPRPRDAASVGSGLKIEGADRDALQARHSDEAIFDLGLGRDHMRFLIRTPKAEVRHALTAAQGLSLDALLPRCGGLLLRESPTRIVDSAFGRIEVYAPIPAPGGKSPPGPHTHLLPGHLAMQRATAPSVDLPAAYSLCATFYPRSQPEDDDCLTRSRTE
jgi:predicted Fe-S protein YdhL (DUF1289 family)